MYMRYYPRELKPIRRLQVAMPDKGKKHYWGYDKGDYGIYTTEDQQYMRNLSRIHKTHARSRTFDATESNKYEVINPESIMKKSVVKFTNPEEIRLPSISKASIQTQTQFNAEKRRVATSMQVEQKQEQVKQIRSQRYPGNQRRVHTEENETYPKEIKFEPGTRFSPTFVCSVLNPLPSYIIQPQHYRSREYTRVESERKYHSIRRYERY